MMVITLMKRLFSHAKGSIYVDCNYLFLLSFITPYVREALVHHETFGKMHGAFSEVLNDEADRP